MSRRLSWVCCSLVPVLAVACGSTPPAFDDAGVDGAPGEDAPGTEDAPGSGNAVVHVRRLQFDGAPDPAAVVFHTDAAGALLGMETTGADGSVELAVTAGDAVTVRFGGQSASLLTVGGVKPGDDLWFGPRAFIPAGQMIVTVPDHPSGGMYEIRGPCIVPVSGTSTDVVVRWYDGCPDTRTVIAVALGAGVNGDDVYFTAPLTIANGGTVELTGTWTEPVDVSLTLQNLASDAVTFSGALMSGEYTTTYDGFERGSQLQTITWQRPATLNDGTLFSVNVEGVGVFKALKLLPPGTAAVDLAQRVPTITDVDTSGGIVWTVSAADPIDAFLLYTDERDGKGQTLARWNFFLPPDARSLVRPQIPDAPATSFFEIELVDVAGAGYDQFRPQAATIEILPVRVPAGYDVQGWKTRINN